jgi:hypothetical protein
MVERQIGRGPQTKLVTFENALALLNEISPQYVDAAMRQAFKRKFEVLVSGNLHSIKWIEVQKWSLKSIQSGAMSPRVGPVAGGAACEDPVSPSGGASAGPAAAQPGQRLPTAGKGAIGRGDAVANFEVESVGKSGNVFRVVPSKGKGKDRCSWSAVEQESLGGSSRSVDESVGEIKYVLTVGRDSKNLPVYKSAAYGFVVQCSRLIEVACGLHGTDASRVSFSLGFLLFACSDLTFSRLFQVMDELCVKTPRVTLFVYRLKVPGEGGAGDGYSRFITLRQAHLVVEHMSEEDICDDVRDALLEDLRVEVHEIYYYQSTHRGPRRAHSPVYLSSAAGGGPVVEGGYHQGEGAAGGVQDGAEDPAGEQEDGGAAGGVQDGAEDPAGEQEGEDRDFLDQQLPLADDEQDGEQQKDGGAAGEVQDGAGEQQAEAGNMAPLGALVVGGNDEAAGEAGNMAPLGALVVGGNDEAAGEAGSMAPLGALVVGGNDEATGEASNMAPLGALVVGGNDEAAGEDGNVVGGNDEAAREGRVLSEGIGAAMEEVAADLDVAVGSKRAFSESAQAYAKSVFEGRVARQKLDLEQRRGDYVFSLVQRLADIQAMASLSDADRELASERIRGLIRDAY